MIHTYCLCLCCWKWRDTRVSPKNLRLEISDKSLEQQETIKESKSHPDFENGDIEKQSDQIVGDEEG